jgi:hypothetical protein
VTHDGLYILDLIQANWHAFFAGNGLYQRLCARAIGTRCPTGSRIKLDGAYRTLYRIDKTTG